MSNPKALSWPELDRRAFLKATALACGGLAIGWWLPTTAQAQDEDESELGEFVPNAWIKVSGGKVILVVDRSEMGQGVMTSLPMLIAEELEISLQDVELEQAPLGGDYLNRFLGVQGTGGSTSIRAGWEPLRQAGAMARIMLVTAAAETWQVDSASCRAEAGHVHHRETGRSLSYGELATKAASLQLPQTVELKPLQEHRLVGKPTRRLDTPLKVDGSAKFGIDVSIPDLLTATIVRPPVFGGKVESLDAEKARAIPGVRRVVEIPGGVAVVADDYWTARRGREALVIKWDDGPHASLSSEEIRAQFVQEAEGQAAVAESLGDLEAGFKAAETTLEAVYEVPYLAHAPLEPQNCTAHTTTEGVEIWGPLQMQTLTQNYVAQATGHDPANVHIHTTFLGGGFGRRLEWDYAVEAALVSQRAGVPVKVIWSREEDTQGGYYRPATYNRLKAGIDAQGLPVAWQHRIVGQSIIMRWFHSVKNGIDSSSVEGAIELPYAIPNRHVDYVLADTPVPVAFWRSVGHSQNAFIVESFLDELAHAAGQDPYHYRRKLLANSPRHLDVLRVAAHKAGWGKPLPEGRARGIAVHNSFGSFAAHVVEASLDEQGEVRVHRVVCAIDCGHVVNPDTVRAQMESGVVFGLTAALYGQITLENGRVQQSNFHDYRLLRMYQMPQVDVHILRGNREPGGVGEPGVPPVAPALTNALFALTGKRIRSLPVDPEELR